MGFCFLWGVFKIKESCYTLPTMIQEEKIQVVDEHTGEPTGQTVPRSEIFEKKLWCRTTNIFFDREFDLLCLI